MTDSLPLEVIIVTGLALVIVAGLAALAIRRAGQQAESRLEDMAIQLADVTAKLAERDQRLQDLDRLNGELSVRADQAEGLEHQLSQAREKESMLRSDLARLDAEHKAQAAGHQEKIDTLTALNEKIQQELKLLTHQALEENRKKGQADLVQMMKPFAEHIEKYEARLKDVEKARVEAYGNLSAQVKNLFTAQNAVQTQTTQLITALKTGPKTAGRWGEEKLRNVLEMAGMDEHCDFETEKSFKRDDARLRPDVILHLPGGRQLVVDAKTNIASYMDALEADSDDQRDLLLTQHAKQLRNHVKELGAKSYWDNLTFTPDFVVMFVPGDNFYAAALEKDHTLFDDAIANKVIIATPTTLIALAKAVAFGWRQDRIAEKAQEAATLGADLYAALRTFGGHIVNVGKGVEKSVEHYNKMVSSLERTVFSKARRFPELGIISDNKDLPELKEIESHTSQLKGRDLVLPEDDTTPRQDLLS